MPSKLIQVLGALRGGLSPHVQYIQLGRTIIIYASTDIMFGGKMHACHFENLLVK
jgi:hypothetical protein